MKTIIVDDERLARKELISLLASFDFIEVIKECANADEAKEAIEQLKPDLVFLDIQMPEKTGFELLEELDYVPQVIFVTAYDEFAIKAFEVNALDYILKPVDSQRLEKTLLKLKEENSEFNREESKISNEKLTLEDQIFIKDGDKCWFVELKNVRLFESEGNYVRVYFDKSKPLILKSLNNLERRLSDKDFFRANRKHIINLKQVAKIESWFNGGLLVTLKDEKAIEISRRQAVKLKDRMIL